MAKVQEAGISGSLVECKHKNGRMMWQEMSESPRDQIGLVLADKSSVNDRDGRGKQMKKDTWLLKGIIPTPLFIHVRFFQ